MLEVGELSLDLSTRRVSHGGDEVNLTPTEFSVLEMLMRHAGNITRAARAAGQERRAFGRLVKKYGLKMEVVRVT